MTAILSVDPAALSRLAQRIRQAIGPAGSTDHRALPTNVAGLGHPALVQAAGGFSQRWAVALTELTDDAQRLADALDLTARAYRDADSLLLPRTLR